jgi:hypothetical protein
METGKDITVDETLDEARDETTEQLPPEDAWDDDGVFSEEVGEDEDLYELTEDELNELADMEDEEPEETEKGSDDAEDGSDDEADAGDTSDGETLPPVGEGDADGEDVEGAQEGAEGAPTAAPTDYSEMATADLAEINRLYPSLGITDLRTIDNAGRYGALRELGLSVEEAFNATNQSRIRAASAHAPRRGADGKAHIKGDLPASGAAAKGFSLTAREMREARELFPGKSDKEITELYRSVSH